MKRLAIYSLLFVSIALFSSIVFYSPIFAQSSKNDYIPDICKNIVSIKGAPSCSDGIDNSNPPNGKADYYGVDCDKNGSLDLEPDPSCKSPLDTEKSDESAGRFLSCYNFCTFSDILKTINNAITFLITDLFVPTLVIIFMLAGAKYILAQGNSAKIANIKKILINIIIGVLLILCSWLIVKVLLVVLVKDDASALQFLE